MIKVESSKSEFDNFYGKIKNFMMNDISVLEAEEKIIKGYRSPDSTPIWLRDHTHQMKGFKYWETDMKSAVEYLLEKQFPDGMLYDFVTLDKCKRTFSYSRCPVEADVEYLAIEAVYTIWQVTGDNEWTYSRLPILEKALNYTMTDPFRWSQKYELVKRPFTIDTWDFEYKYWANPPYNPSKSKMCIMHGDNSGMYMACCLLSKLFGYFNDRNKEDFWQEKAMHFKSRMNKICWGGHFYRHQVHLDPIESVKVTPEMRRAYRKKYNIDFVDLSEVDEDQQLSLSNPYDINRGVCNHEQAVSIINEYRRRKDSFPSFAEWYSINPPFPPNTFGQDYLKGWSKSPGNYVNGGIMPLVGGELARACFEHGYEKYGVDILKRYMKMIYVTNQTYLWYHPDGRAGISSPSTLPTDGWGAAAMLAAFVEGLIGVKDKGRILEKIEVSPRWSCADVERVQAIVRYDYSGAYLRYEYFQKEHCIILKLEGSYNSAKVHLLLPQNKMATRVTLNNSAVSFKKSSIEKSNYVDCTINQDGILEVGLRTEM